MTSVMRSLNFRVYQWLDTAREDTGAIDLARFD